mmetsp:Transcript_71675/g.226483  ORF Transcript_71675/g.226483 Transcript_71675/m.226483 type:complete len:215 (+) Transcript_71675:83-727(+)
MPAGLATRRGPGAEGAGRSGPVGRVLAPCSGRVGFCPFEGGPVPVRAPGLLRRPQRGHRRLPAPPHGPVTSGAGVRPARRPLLDGHAAPQAGPHPGGRAGAGEGAARAPGRGRREGRPTTDVQGGSCKEGPLRRFQAAVRCEEDLRGLQRCLEGGDGKARAQRGAPHGRWPGSAKSRRVRVPPPSRLRASGAEGGVRGGVRIHRRRGGGGTRPR